MKLNNVKGGEGKIVKIQNIKAFNAYLSESKKYKPLTKQEEYILFEEFNKTKDEKLIDKIFKHNMLFVVSVARHYSAVLNTDKFSLEDLVNEGNLGLIKAIHKFDYTRDIKFISYAVWYVKMQILDFINTNIKLIRLPESIKSVIKKLEHEQNELSAKLNRSVDIYEALNSLTDKEEINTIPFNEIMSTVNIYKFETSLNELTINDDNTIELIDLLKSDDLSPQELILNNERNHLLTTLLNIIPDENLEYIKDYYGLDDREPLTYKEIAIKFNKKDFQIRNSVEKYIRILRNRNRKNTKYFFPKGTVIIP